MLLTELSAKQKEAVEYVYKHPNSSIPTVCFKTGCSYEDLHLINSKKLVSWPAPCYYVNVTPLGKEVIAEFTKEEGK